MILRFALVAHMQFISDTFLLIIMELLTATDLPYAEWGDKETF
jgi:hypothetical protein